MKKEKISGSVKCISTAIIAAFLGGCFVVARPVGEPGPGPGPQQPIYDQSQQPQPEEEQPSYQPASEYQPESGVPEPPSITFTVQPSVVVLPDTNNVYVVPDAQTDMFFWNGWWWRSWDGYWYRSQYYDRDWSYYNQVPSFYYEVDPQWRAYYRNHNWQGHPWYYQQIPDRELRNNWKTWQNDQYWQRQRTWNVRNYQPPSRQQMQVIRYQRERVYQQRQQAEQRHWQQEHGQQGPQQPRGRQGQLPWQQRQQQLQPPQQQEHGQQGPQQSRGRQEQPPWQQRQQQVQPPQQQEHGQQGPQQSRGRQGAITRTTETAT